MQIKGQGTPGLKPPGYGITVVPLELFNEVVEPITPALTPVLNVFPNGQIYLFGELKIVEGEKIEPELGVPILKMPEEYWKGTSVSLVTWINNSLRGILVNPVAEGEISIRPNLITDPAIPAGAAIELNGLNWFNELIAK